MQQVYADVKAVAARYDVSVPTIWRWAGKRINGFPSPETIGPNSTRWRLDLLDRWDAARQPSEQALA